MGGEVFIVVVLFGVLVGISKCSSIARRTYPFRAHEEEMLHCVGHTWHIICIAKASNVNVDSSASFVCIWVMDKKGLKLVRESDDSVGSVIKRWSLQLVCDAFYGSHTGSGKGTDG